MKKKMTILVGSVVFIALAMASCSNPTAGEETAAVTLYISGASTSRAAYPYIPGNGAFHDSINYKIYFETGTPATHGNAPTDVKTGPGPHTVQVTPGAYRLFIVAVLGDGVTYAEMDDSNSGVKYIDVDTRTTTTIPVAMHAKFPVYWEDTNWDTSLQSYIGSSKTTPVSVKVAVELSPDNWIKIITAIVKSDLDNIDNKVIDLDLSYCTTPSNIFDPTPGAPGGKAKIKKITLPLDAYSMVEGVVEGVDSPPHTVFEGFTNLVEVNAPSITHWIGAFAFNCLTSLKSIYIPNAMHLRQGAFEGCSSLINVTSPKIETISSFVFKDCTSLKTVSLRKAKVIGVYAFEGCTSLESITLPEITDEIYGHVFKDCTSLKTVSFSKATIIPDSAFEGCTKLANVSLPEATSIGEGAFIHCTSLTTVSLPKVKSIGANAFSDCDISFTLKIPKIESIGDNAFQNTGNALTLMLGSTPPKVGRNLFSGAPDGPQYKRIDIYFPEGTAIDNPAGYDLSYTIPWEGTVTNGGNSAWLRGLLGAGWENGIAGSDPVTNTFTIGIESWTPAP